MSVGIIIRPSGYHRGHRGAPVFQAHFNRSMGDAQNPAGKYYHTKEEYYSDLKKKGLEPYDPSAQDSGKRKPYKPSKDLREVTQSIHDHTKRGKFKPSEKLLAKMENMGVKLKITKEEIARLPKHYQSGQGGFE